MAITKNIVDFADFILGTDAVVTAADRMRAAVNDATYERARRAFMAAKPTTAAGVLEKSNMLRSIIESMDEGGTLTEAGCREVVALYRDVATPLQEFSRAV